jgi:S1-C subfamily serine protease
MKRTRNTRISLMAALPVAATLLAATGVPATADEGVSTPTEQIAPLVQPSVVYETTTWSGRVWDKYNHHYIAGDTRFVAGAQCTGFVVNPDGWVATAGHCVDPLVGKEMVRQAAAEWAAEHIDYTDPDVTAEDLLGQFRVLSVDRVVNLRWGAVVSGVDVEKRIPARVVDFQSFNQGDAALLKVEQSELNAIQLAGADDVEMGSDVTSVGYPGVIRGYTDPDLTPTFQPGTVSSLKQIRNGLLSVVQLSTELSPGMSGGPTVDTEGQVIGINSARFPGEAISYAVPTDRITELMASNGVENVVSETTLQYRTGIQAYFAGDRDTAVAALTAVLDEQPANGLAEEFLGKAKDLPAPPEPASDDGSGLTRWALMGGGGSVVVLATLLGAVMLIRRKSQSGAALSRLGDVNDPATQTAGLPDGFTPYDGGEPAMAARTPVAVGAVNGSGPAGSPAENAPSSLPDRHAYCTTCGHLTPLGMAFCGHCGTKQHTG